jgi:hypothetical protein
VLYLQYYWRSVFFPSNLIYTAVQLLPNALRSFPELAGQHRGTYCPAERLQTGLDARLIPTVALLCRMSQFILVHWLRMSTHQTQSSQVQGVANHKT